jgi:hypothetical protein
LAVDAVLSEPNSDPFSLLNRELTGNFLDFGSSGANFRSIRADFISDSGQIP